MATRHGGQGIRKYIGLILFSQFAIAGCKPSPAPLGAGAETVVALPGIDLNPDGTIGERGMQKIQSHSGDPNLTVAFIRANLTDEGLAQLGQFPNIRHVQAIGSHVSDKGIAKLKEAIPEVEVSY